MKWVVLVLWLFSSSGYLYYLSFAVPESASINGFLLFTFILAGGGISYDIASKMFTIPSYKGYWIKLLTRMLLILFGHGLVLFGIFLAGYLSGIFVPIISIGVGALVSVFGIILSSYNAYKAENIFKRLRGKFM